MCCFLTFLLAKLLFHACPFLYMAAPSFAYLWRTIMQGIRSFARCSYAMEEARTRATNAGSEQIQRAKPRKLLSALSMRRKLRHALSSKRETANAIPIFSYFSVFLFTTPFGENRLSIPRVINSCLEVMKMKTMDRASFPSI